MGACHLLGRQGLLYLLEQNGFTISMYSALANDFVSFNACNYFNQMGETIDLLRNVTTILT